MNLPHSTELQTRTGLHRATPGKFCFANKRACGVVQTDNTVTTAQDTCRLRKPTPHTFKFFYNSTNE